jgi:hypothetical protein
MKSELAPVLLFYGRTRFLFFRSKINGIIHDTKN